MWPQKVKWPVFAVTVIRRFQCIISWYLRLSPVPLLTFVSPSYWGVWHLVQKTIGFSCLLQTSEDFLASAPATYLHLLISQNLSINFLTEYFLYSAFLWAASQVSCFGEAMVCSKGELWLLIEWDKQDCNWMWIERIKWRRKMPQNPHT